MEIEKILRKRLKKLKERFPGLHEEEIEKELIPLRGEEELLKPKVGKRKKHL